MIYGKFLAWDEGRSRKHETDIYDMLVFRYLEADPTLAGTFDEAYLDAQARALRMDVEDLWQSVKQAARDEAGREDLPNTPESSIALLGPVSDRARRGRPQQGTPATEA